MLRKVFLCLFSLLLSHLPCFADYPAQEIFIIKTSKLIELKNRYIKISHIPKSTLRETCLYTFYGGACSFEALSISTPNESIQLRIYLNFPSTMDYEIISIPKSSSAYKFETRGKLELITSEPDPNPAPEALNNNLDDSKPNLKKRSKMRELAPYQITSHWEEAEYVLILFSYNLKK